MTTKVDCIFELRPAEVANLLKVSIDRIKRGASNYAANSGQSTSNFNVAWNKWADGKQNMPMKVEQYLRDAWEMTDAGTEEHDASKKRLSDKLNQIWADYRREVIAEYVKEHDCHCAEKK
jgi:hypothetical protein